MADSLFDAMKGGAPKLGATGLLRLDPLAWRGAVDQVTFSGGVSEYVYGWETESFGDLGNLLAAEIRARVADWGVRLEPPAQGIRATVIGASQYTTQVSGSTIFVSPLSALPLRNVPVIAPGLLLGGRDRRCRCRRRLDPHRAAASRSRRCRYPGRDFRSVARLGDIPAPRRVLPRRRRGP